MFRFRLATLVAGCLALAALVCTGRALADDQKPPQMPPAPVQAGLVVEREVAAGRTFVGTVTPERTSLVGSDVEGLVVELLARDGDRVEQGAPLAKLRTRTAELMVAAARADLASARAQLEELENGTRPEEVEQARARLAAAKAERFNRDWLLQSTKELLDKEQISEDAYQAALAASRKASADETIAAEALKLLELGPRKERVADARARVDAAAARVERLDDDLGRATIRAPFTGYVVKEHTEAGQWLGKGDAVVEMAALDRVDVVVPVLEDYVGALKKGAEARVDVAAAGAKPFEGHISEIVPRGDSATRTFAVKVRVDNPRDGDAVRLFAGMFARVTLSIGTLEKGLLVPKDALVLGGRTPVVYLVAPGQGGQGFAAVPVPVELGVADDGMIQVRGELKAGAQVVTRGNERLFPGQSIQVITDKPTKPDQSATPSDGAAPKSDR